ncbi:MAG TPA: hypothetical protein VNX15_07865 [Gemmatimonadales bacterium]|nr:hypothetical protein [Gemmatimonadales bacterium]
MNRPSVFLVFALLNPVVLIAQEQSTPPRVPFNADFICAQTDSQHLARVEFEPLAQGATVGPVLSCGPNGLTLGAFAGLEGQTIDPTSVRRLWVRRGSGFAGAIWGAIGGGLLGYAIASARTHICDQPPNSPIDSTHCHANVGPAIALGAGAGVGIGWFFGRGIPRWKPVYRATP